MIVAFGDGADEAFDELPRPVREKVAGLIDLLSVFPEMYPLRRRGLMKGYRPGRMELA